ncbi:hypothetical protein AVEN_192822-1 [Araneus ventricosus]|uniref:DNA helicase Pif1-like 2B domain-containing protein n=1 Tax=Araneus ventricosus TaxID=182803 RepID=A0A4Y2C9K7_ARAVE|nr:hypothetical protein AVEN_192822-1 [Araneus ventricosus]
MNIQNIQWLQERAILIPLNEKVREINFTVQIKVPTAARTYYSIDKCLNDEEATSYPVEFLNSLNPSCIPLHRLVLKVLCPIMLLRNLNPPKLCNGSRLIVRALRAHIIEATILTGPVEGEHVLIPRIPLIPTDLPFSFQRLQFPLWLAFAITINKAQGNRFESQAWILLTIVSCMGNCTWGCQEGEGYINIIRHRR